MTRLNPVASSVPSESTVEQLSNHWIMNLIGPCHAWFYVPTKSEEKFLGYDASLQRYKALAIQYKRLKPGKNVGSITINQNQHNVLVSNFPKRSKPYVFYAFSKYKEYSKIQDIYTKGKGIKFCQEMVFFDVHSVSIKGKTKSISYSYLVRKKIATYDIFQIVREFRKCNVGIKYKDTDSVQIRTEGSKSTRVNLMIGKV